jgi:hypothetical protein
MPSEARPSSRLACSVIREAREAFVRKSMGNGNY